MPALTLPPSADTEIHNPLDELLGYQLRRASAVMMSDLARRLEVIDLRPTEASVLLLIADNPGVTQSDVGRALGIARANMAPIAAQLTSRGLIDRTRPDRRSQGLLLTSAGSELAQRVRQTIDVHEAHFLPDASGEDRESLTRLIRSVWAVAG